MPPPNDPDITRLQVQVEGINNAISALLASQSAQFSAIAARLDGFTAIVREIADMQAKQQAHSSGLDRAFEEIKVVRSEHDDTEDRHDAWHDNHELEHKDLHRKLNRGFGWVSGAAAVIGVLLCVVMWVGNRLVDQVDHTTSKVNEVQIQLLEYKLEQAKRGVP